MDRPRDGKHLLLKPAEAAAELGVSQRQAYRLIATGQIPSVRVGNQPRVPWAALEAWIAAELQKPENPAA